MNAWPALMRRKTAATYLDMSEAAFEREVLAGRLPQPETWGGRDHWRKEAIDAAINPQHHGEPEWRKRLRSRYDPKAA